MRTERLPPVLAWSLLGVIVVLAAGSLILSSMNVSLDSSDVLVVSSLLACSTVGSLIASRHPDNVVGWILVVGTLLWVLGEFALQYATYALETRPGALPGGVWLAWLGSWIDDIGWAVLSIFTPLLFPTGRLPSPRWRPLRWVAVSLLVVHVAAQPFAIGPLQGMPSISNPLGNPYSTALLHFEQRLEIVLLGTVVASLVSVVVRFRHAVGVERQQLKWIAYVVAMLGVVVAVQFLNSQTFNNSLVDTAMNTLGDLASLAFPLTVGIAILRYRLYDIDVIVNRTLVYGTLTGTLALLYFGTVVVLQGIVRSIGGVTQSELVTVVSTLTIAAMFQPLRRRIQTVIDRGFYRRRYDAQKTLEAFSARLRDETDLQRLTNDTLAVVQETLQPGHVSLWLREKGIATHDPATRI